VQAQSSSLSTEARLAIVTQLDCLDKILADEVLIERDSANQDIHVTELPKEQKRSYRIASATDPNATYRVHGEDKVDLGYNVNVAATTRFIREIRADTGAQPDAVGMPELLDAQIEHHDLAPSKFIYDAAAGAGKTRFQVAQVTDGQTQLVAPLIPYDERTDRFTPADFTLSEACPERCPEPVEGSNRRDGTTPLFRPSLPPLHRTSASNPNEHNGNTEVITKGCILCLLLFVGVVTSGCLRPLAKCAIM
jgi:hypothetical protein